EGLGIVDRGHREDVEPPQGLGHAVVPDASEDADTIDELERRSETLVGFRIAPAIHLEAEGEPLAGQDGGGAKEDIRAVFRRVPFQIPDDGGRTPAAGWRGLEALPIHSEGDDVD